jgi:hypothetical protein
VSLCSAEKGRSCVWWLREDKKIAGGEDCKPKKKNNRGKGAMAWFRPGEKIRFRFFFLWLP